MNDISVGAVGAAVIAGLVSILGLIIGKEQKISEFRQAWIDDLRKCMVAYLVQINAIADALRTKSKPGAPSTTNIIDSYKALNEASHGITFRVNPDEPTAQKLLESMDAFEKLASVNASLTPANIKAAETAYIEASKDVLKYEWKRVKRGEKTYVIARLVALASTFLMLALMGYLLYSYRAKPNADAKGLASAHITNNFTDCFNCNPSERQTCQGVRHNEGNRQRALKAPRNAINLRAQCNDPRSR